MKTLLSAILLLAGSAVCFAAGAPEFYHPFATDVKNARTFTYVTKDGDTLFHLAERFLGSAYRAQELAELNGIGDPLRLAAGTEIKVPLPNVGIRYWIEKISPEGDIVEWKPSDRMDAGDRFQIRLTANWSGYLYVFNRSASGEVHRILPAGPKPLAVKAFTEYLLPAKGVLQLDDAAGAEELWVVLSGQRIHDFDALMEASSGERAATDSAGRYLEAASSQKGVSVVTDDDSDEPETRVSVSPEEGKIVLVHRILVKRR